MAHARTRSTGNHEGTTETGFVYDDIYLEHVLSTTHPESPERLETITAYMEQTGLMARVRQLDLSVEPLQYVLAVHNQTHHESVQNCEPTGRVAAQAVAEILGAVRSVHEGAVRNAFCAIRPPGHHSHNNTANYDGSCKGQGFCFYGNVAIAARYAQSLGYQRILICDWDYHHGNGTEWAFYDDPSVFFFSTHNWQAYPGTGAPSRTGIGDGAGYNLNVHLPPGSGNAEIVAAWEQRLLPSLAELDFSPDFVLISAGFDSRVNDTLGVLSITDAGFADLTRIAMSIADEHCGGRIVSCLEGGYNVDGTARAVCAHVATLAGLDWGDYIPTKAQSRRGLGHPVRQPDVQHGILYVPPERADAVERITVLDAAGREVYTVPETEIGRTAFDLWPDHLAAGMYVVRVWMRGSNPVDVPYRD